MEEMLYGGELGPRVRAVNVIDDFKLLITFDNGERRVFNAKPLLEINVFNRLKNPAFFNLAKAEYGTVVWPEDIDYCPDCLYKESVPQ